MFDIWVPKVFESFEICVCVFSSFSVLCLTFFRVVHVSLCISPVVWKYSSLRLIFYRNFMTFLFIDSWILRNRSFYKKFVLHFISDKFCIFLTFLNNGHMDVMFCKISFREIPFLVTIVYL